MYYYIYDTFLNDKKYERVLDRIKARLLELEIQGKHEQLTLLKNIDELIADEIKKGAKTIVVIGNNRTFLKVVNTIAHKDVTLGIIPVGPNNNLAKTLGIPLEEQACEIIGARKVVKLDLGKIKDQYFFSNLKITKNLTRLSIKKDSYSIIPKLDCGEISLYNFYFPEEKQPVEKKLKKVSAQDSLLEIVFKSKVKQGRWFKKKNFGLKLDTLIQGNRCEIKSFEYIPILLDEYKVLKTPVVVEVEPKKLKVIVGKERLKNIE